MTLSVQIEDYGSACRYLLELKARGVSLGLERMQRLMQSLGNPERTVPCIHVAGTNGKGSVSAMLESILRSAGWRTGLYTSPHLVRLGERIQVDRNILNEPAIVGYVGELKPVVASLDAAGEGSEPSYFEVMTAMAFLHFARSRCDIACIEVGLGGRMDATNVVTPELSVITSIGYDHVEMLGNTLTAIATEKAGIIKQGRPIVIGRLHPEAETIIRSIASAREAPVISVRAEFGDDLADDPTTNLEGEYQRSNAATAMLAARTLLSRWRISHSVISAGLHSVDWPARWQRFSLGDRTVILDSSHNEEGAQTLDANLSALSREFGRAPIVVLGVLGFSRVRPLVDVVCRHANEIHFVQPAQSRACSYEQLKTFVPATHRGPIVRQLIENLFPAAGVCTAGAQGDVIVVTGSIALAGEVLSRIDPARGTHEGNLQDF